MHGWGGSFRDTWQKPGIDALLEDIGRVGSPLQPSRVTQTRTSPLTQRRMRELPQWFLERLPAEAPVIDAVGFSLGALTILASPYRSTLVALERSSWPGSEMGFLCSPPPNANQKNRSCALEGNALRRR